ncbi:MAG: 23S rRNA (pseudouridine(1915)-N(3))-methyltransferase RlmH [Pseudomonadota bacterium]|nr:23S rRNA (pseudouridine(1915)-N(3))-methyltransferase RlmH [Pseudomonadota bacterium]
MRITIVSVGKARSGPLADLYAEYARRMVWPLTLKEIDSRKQPTPDAQKKHEAGLILGALPENAVVLVLDETGKTMTSPALAARLGQWRDNGVRDLAVVIGGADGLDDSIRKKADLILSFGAMTWPHMLVRVLAAEQLYRCQQILAGHPYHRS